MDRHGKGMSQNVIRISISPTQVATNTEKRYRTAKMKEIISTVCALLNSGGGLLELLHDRDVPKQHIDALIRRIERCVVEMIGITSMTLFINFEVNPQGIILHIQEARKLVSVNYNLYLPSKRQVVALPATEPTNEINKIIQRKTLEENSPHIGSHLRRFVIGQKTDLKEGTDVEIKSLKASPSKCVTLADRIVGKSNKLACYVSAFANHRGGLIYYGVNDDGIVNGEQITEKEKAEIINKVTKTINKMVWPQNCGQPQRGKQWDIFFEAVVDNSNNPVPSTFVIIITVPPCLGGVFTEEPESYHIVEGEILKMSLQDWWRSFTGIWKHTTVLSVPSHVSRVCWSSENNRNVCHMLSERLVQYRNDEDKIAFNKLSKLAITTFPESDAKLVVMAEKAVFACKHQQFGKAESLLNELSTLLRSSKNSSIFEVRMLLLQCTIEHSKGNYDASYEVAQAGLQKMQLIPADLLTLVFYIEAARVTTTVLTTTYEFQRHRLLKDEALMFLQLAARDANSIEDLPVTKSDFRQKLHIYKAWTLLECSVTGDVVQQKHGISCEDIESAAGELVSVYESVLKGSTLTHFRKLQYDLAQSDLFRRRSETPDKDYIQNLKQAFECASKARATATKHRFENMLGYANKRLADLLEKLVRHAVQTRGRVGNKNFFGFKY